MMERHGEHKITQVVTALLLAAAILLGTLLMAQRIQHSTLYQQSRIAGSILSQDSIGIRDLFSSRKNLNMFTKFAGAVTSAYINFELIPLNEAATFSTVLESINPDITVEKFEYQRKNLTIDGTSTSVAGYEQFIEQLRQQQHFQSISGDYYLSTDNLIRFQIVCVAFPSTSAHFGFGQSD